MMFHPAKAALRSLRAREAPLRLALKGRWAALSDPQFRACRVKNPLICVVTGMERSGTTLISQLLNGHPRIAAGVECGLLLSSLSDFHRISPFYDWMTSDNWGWALRPQDRARLLKARSYDEAYCLLGRLKGRAQSDPELQKIFSEADLIYDKTPSYVYKLFYIVKKIEKPIDNVKFFEDPMEKAIRITTAV